METVLNRQESFSFAAMPSPNIPNLAKVRQDLPLPDSSIGAFELSLYGTHGSYITCIRCIENATKKQSSNNSNNK